MIGSVVELLVRFWPFVTASFWFIFLLSTSVHALLYKRDSRAAIGWIGLIWLVPIVGSILYILLGINRIKRRVSGTRGDENNRITSGPHQISIDDFQELLDQNQRHLVSLSRLGERLSGQQLFTGNTVTPLYNGDQAYPAMLAAIESAEISISLTSYIFDNDTAGKRFADALISAHNRGVQVRVLIDSVGSRYTIPPITHRLKTNGVRCAQFMPSFFPWTTPYMNLRSHRKILVVDGLYGFTGGMNIRQGCISSSESGHVTLDIHFSVTGPVVQHLQATFAEDWEFTTKEKLSGSDWFPPQHPHGKVFCRAVPDGPDHNFDRMRLCFLGALSTAQRSVRIMTPYFLPDSALISALNTCAMRGVQVDIVLPESNNLKMVAWAAQAQLWQVLEWGARVWYSPPPFDHSKVLTVDSAWSLIGSANWDPRSLRLNFELGLECYCSVLAEELNRYVDSRIAESRQVNEKELNSRPVVVKLRDAAMRLAAPYL